MALSCLLNPGSVHPDTFRGHCGWTRKSDAEETLAHRSKMPSLHTQGLEQEGEVVDTPSGSLNTLPTRQLQPTGGSDQGFC